MKSSSEDPYGEKKQECTLPGGLPGPRPGARPMEGCLVAGILPMGSGLVRSAMLLGLVAAVTPEPAGGHQR